MLDRFPLRLTGTAGERGLQRACAAELENLGGVAEWQDFRWGRSIYQSLALHFGLASAALVLGFWAPVIAACVHVVVAASYISESAWKRPLLRWLLPFARSQNVVVVFPSPAGVGLMAVTRMSLESFFSGRVER